MHIQLADLLVCPRCGPAHGLVLLADRTEARRVLQGSLGCPNCRERYRVVEGRAELRPAGEADPEAMVGVPRDGRSMGPPAETGGLGEEPAVRIAALLGLAEATGTILMVGPPARHAAALAALVGVEVVAAGPDAPAAGPAEAAPPEGEAGQAAGVSPVSVGARLPFATRSLRGAVLAGSAILPLLRESVRAVAPGSRLLLLNAPPQAGAEAEAAGCRILVQEGATLVAERTGSADPPKLYQLL